MAAALSLLLGETAEQREEEVEVVRRVVSMMLSFLGDDDLIDRVAPLVVLLSGAAAAVVVPLAKPAALAARAVTRCMQMERRRGGRASEAREEAGKGQKRRFDLWFGFFFFLQNFDCSDLPEVDVDDVSAAATAEHAATLADHFRTTVECCARVTVSAECCARVTVGAVLPGHRRRPLSSSVVGAARAAFSAAAIASARCTPSGISAILACRARMALSSISGRGGQPGK